MNKKKTTSDKPGPLDTILSLLGHENLQKYGGMPGLRGVPLCYWLRCLTGKPKAKSYHCAGDRQIPTPEVRYFPLTENRYLIQALLALCCFFSRERTGETSKTGYAYPFVVKSTRNPCREFLFLKVGKELVALVDQVRFHHLEYLNEFYRRTNMVAVYLQSKDACLSSRPLESKFLIPPLDGEKNHDPEEIPRISVHRILPVPANELLNGLFRLRKINKIRKDRGQEELPEDLRTMLIPFLYRQRRQLRRLPMHRARISEI